MIGISSYFQDLNLDYLKAASELGVTHVFTSLIVMEEDFSDIKEKSKMLLEFAKENHMVIIPDISPITLKKLDLENIEDVRKYGFEAIRVDGGFSNLEDSKRLIELFEVYLNASDVKPAFIKELTAAGCDMSKVSVFHNFYPKVFTGLNKDSFIEINKGFKELGLRVGAFVPGDVKLRGPVFNGLPTLEKHRGVHPFVACVELFDCFVDDVYVGDNEVSMETLKMMIEYDRNRIMSMKAVIDEAYPELYGKEMPIRRDITDDLVRFFYGRGVYKVVKPRNALNRYRGSITIDNDLSGRYVGEIDMCRRDLPSDGCTNVIGHIYPEFLELLKFIKRDTVVKFVK